MFSIENYNIFNEELARSKRNITFWEECQKCELKDETLPIAKNKREKLLIKYNQVYGINTKILMNFFLKLLNATDNKFELKENEKEYLLTSNDNSVVFKFPKKEKTNVSDDIIKSNHDIIKYSKEIKKIILNLVYYCAKKRYTTIEELYESNKETYKDEKIIEFILKTLPLYYEPLKNNLKIDERLIELTTSIIEDIVFENCFMYEDDETIKDLEECVEALMNGEYNSLVSKEWWFIPKVEKQILVSWHKIRKNEAVSFEPAIEDYSVFIYLNEIISHINYLSKNNEAYVDLMGHKQTKATDEELVEIAKLQKRVLNTHHTWREAREIRKNTGRLRVPTDELFPHNIESIIKCFSPNVITFYDKVDEDFNLKGDPNILSIRANELIKSLENSNIKTIFRGKPTDYIDEYFRRMILSILLIDELTKNRNMQEKEIVRQELLKRTIISDAALNLLFNEYKTGDEVFDLITGLLKTYTHPEEKLINLFSACTEIQKDLHCDEGTVGYNDYNTLSLPNDECLYSPEHDDIEGIFNSLQEQYDYYYYNANDLEFVEGCVEIFSRIIIEQMFRKGNKRTAKCLLNKMLLSRSIIPPVADLNENESELFDEIVLGRDDFYARARYKLLLQTIDVHHKLETKHFYEPLMFVEDENIRAERYL